MTFARRQQGALSRIVPDRRRYKRISVTLLGRFMRESKEEHPCKLVDVSAGGAAVTSLVSVPVGERVVAYFDHIGGIEGVVVRSCKNEGCWAEVAENADSKSIRIEMKEHRFFIPLQSAGAQARVEGTFIVKVLSKEQVDHMIKDDGAKFDKRNADGTVTEVSFEATGIELKRNTGAVPTI